MSPSSLLADTPKIADEDLESYDALVVAGGLSPMFTYRDNADLRRAIVEFYEAEKLLAVYCHGVSALIDAQLSDGSYLINGQTITGFSNAEEDYSDDYVGQQVMPWQIEDTARERGANHIQSGLFKPFVGPRWSADHRTAAVLRTRSGAVGDQHARDVKRTPNRWAPSRRRTDTTTPQRGHSNGNIRGRGVVCVSDVLRQMK